jgi:HTH-type transcriptional regulator/antitoxin HipB
MAATKKREKIKSIFPINVRSPLQVGNAIRRLRKLKQMSQDELARKSGFTQATVSRIEKGHQKAEIQTLLLMFAALGADLAIVERQQTTPENSVEGLF